METIVLPSAIVGLNFYCKLSKDEISIVDGLILSSFIAERKDSMISKTRKCHNVELPINILDYTLLAIDPGSSSMGIRCETMKNLTCHTLHYFTTLAFVNTTEMLHDIRDKLLEIIGEYKPDIVVVEKQLEKRNSNASIISHCVLMCAIESNLPCVTVDPSVMRSIHGLPKQCKSEMEELAVKMLIHENDQLGINLLSEVKGKTIDNGVKVSKNKQLMDMLDSVIVGRTFQNCVVKTLLENGSKGKY